MHPAAVDAHSHVHIHSCHLPYQPAKKKTQNQHYIIHICANIFGNTDHF